MEKGDLMKRIGTAITAATLLALATLTTARAADKDSDKKSPEPFYRKYLVAGNPLDDRIRDQEKRVDANPTSADLHNDFGNLLAARRFPKQAREQYGMAMKLDKTNFMSAYNLGILEESEDRVSSAISAYEKSIDRNRGFPPARFRLGRLFERRGRTSEAIHEYARAIEIDPDMRLVQRNPLVADTRLLDRVSLTIYNKELARAAIKADALYADARFRRAPTDRPLWSSEIVDPSEPEAVDSTRAPATRGGPTAMPAGVRQIRPQELGGPVAPPPPSPVAVRPTPVPATATDPNSLLLVRPQPPLPTPLPQ